MRPLPTLDPAELDAADPLRHFRDRFVHDDSGLNYLDGNSLGRLPKVTVSLLRDAIERQWGERLIRSWNEGWFELPERIGGKIARLVGAGEDEVVIGDSTSVNLYKLAVAALRSVRDTERRVILTDDLNFPSDLYVLQGIVREMGDGFSVKVIPSRDGVHGDLGALLDAIDTRIALVCLSHTCFKSAYTYDMLTVNARARETGALTLWDLSHSGGSVPVTLSASGADLAVGCTYKYMNGGPGAPAWLFVSRELQPVLRNPISGWMSQRNLFDFGLEYRQEIGMRGYLTGTPPVLSLVAIEPGIDLLLEAGMETLRAKSVLQSDYLVALWHEHLVPLGYTLNSPREAERRGSHVSLGHEEGWRIDQALIHRLNTLPDFRQPDNIRLGIAPLYNTFAEVHAAVHALKEIVERGIYREFSLSQGVVT